MATLLGACAPSGRGDVAASPATPGETTPAPSAPPSTATHGTPSDVDGTAGDHAGDDLDRPEMRGLVEMAIRDLAERRDVPTRDITVVLAERIVWPDTSIGCPLRDRQYFDEPRRGTRIHLRADGVVYRYHTGGRWRDPFLCDPSVRAEPPIRRIEP